MGIHQLAGILSRQVLPWNGAGRHLHTQHRLSMLPAIREHSTGTPLTLDAVRLLIFALHTLKGPFKLFIACGVVCEGKAHLL